MKIYLTNFRCRNYRISPFLFGTEKKDCKEQKIPLEIQVNVRYPHFIET